tara:strand:+ start:44 stop:457 length:414 start_codon:yes stop_codon:yes gene_type:complete
MSHKILEIANALHSAAEVAAEEEAKFEPTVDEQMVAYLQAQIKRADAFLDKRKDKVFEDTLSIRTRGEVERAIIAYDADYLLGLGLSVEATSELAQSLIQIAKKHKVVIPKDWNDIAKMDINLESTSTVQQRRVVVV